MNRSTRQYKVILKYAPKLCLGARSLGLTEKEIFNQIETIKQLAQNEGDEKKKNSPYAHPIQLILTPTGKNVDQTNYYFYIGGDKSACYVYYATEIHIKKWPTNTTQ